MELGETQAITDFTKNAPGAVAEVAKRLADESMSGSVVVCE